jgi:magnesium transporter
MMFVYRSDNGCIVPMSTDSIADKRVIWIDLLEPSDEECHKVAEIFHVRLPTRSQMHQIETSNRFHEEGEVVYMTSVFTTNTSIGKAAENEFENHYVTFILGVNCIITLRHAAINGFEDFIEQRIKDSRPLSTARDVFIALIENATDFIADTLGSIRKGTDVVSHTVFLKTHRKKINYNAALETIGRDGIIISKSRESLVTMGRMISYITIESQNNRMEKYTKTLKTISKDILDLSDYAAFLSSEINFLLDAILGMTSLEQNNIIKIFTLASVILSPPTLVASIYGMNFHHMPELSFQYGYILALTLMFLSGWIPYRYFKKRGWL